MSTPQSKRRKTQHSSKALNKPFKSPLPRNHGSQDQETPSPSLPHSNESSSQHYKPSHSEFIGLGSVSGKASSPLESPHIAQLSSSPFKQLSSPTPRASQHLELLDSTTAVSLSSTSSISFKALQSEANTLQARLATLRQSLDTANQALRLETSNRDTELEQLVDVWTRASRSAAEELFTVAKDRVNGMGGLGAWKQREDERRAGWQDDEQNQRGNIDENGDDCGREGYDESESGQTLEGRTSGEALQQHSDQEVSCLQRMGLVRKLMVFLDFYHGYDAKVTGY